jgi:hypothetical protein
MILARFGASSVLSQSVGILLWCHNIGAVSTTPAPTEETTISTLLVAGLIAVSVLCIIFFCCLWSEKNDKECERTKNTHINAELILLAKQNSNLRCSLQTMEGAYTSLLEKYQPDDLKPLLQEPESKLFWVVKSAP